LCRIFGFPASAACEHGRRRPDANRDHSRIWFLTLSRSLVSLSWGGGRGSGRAYGWESEERSAGRGCAARVLWGGPRARCSALAVSTPWLAAVGMLMPLRLLLCENDSINR